MNLKEIRQRLEQRKGQRIEVLSNLKDEQIKLVENQKELRYSEQARAILHKVAKETQEQLQFHISDMVSMAIGSIFDDPYKFKVSFVVKRGKTECDLLFERNGKTINPVACSGGGALDVASLGLRVALWVLQMPRSRQTLILDEPFKFLSKDLLLRAGELLQELSKRLEMQFIIVTHLKELEDCADKVFNVTIKKGVTKVYA